MASDGKRIIKDHPALHDVYVHGDFVLSGTADRPVLIERHWYCRLCPTVRVDQINVMVWRLVSRRYVRDKDTVIEYATSEDNLKARFLATSSLPAPTIDHLRSI